MTPSRPYLLKALYHWILDNHMTPHVVVDAGYEGVIVPREYVEDNQIVLCIADESVHGLRMDNEYLSFSARFSGVSRDIYLPIMSISAIYSEENRKGMVFAEEEHSRSAHAASSTYSSDNVKTFSQKRKKPKLTVVSSSPQKNEHKDSDADKDKDTDKY
jgi:stringent starvation protein B